MYIVTSKPKRISVYSGLIHMRTSCAEERRHGLAPSRAHYRGKQACATRPNQEIELMIFMK
jgi:hypothetical protein